MGKKSLTKNALLSGGQKLLSIIFPLITFPYISRVLLVDDIGKINFVSSIISYVLLIAALGINNYATREGVKYRENKNELEKFCAEMFSINLVTTAISYVLLFICICMSNKLKLYLPMILLQSITVIGTTIGVNWIYTIHEDYLYITLRTLFMQLISLILMFLFVKFPSDYMKYLAITVLAASGMNIFNLIHARKYVKLRITRKLNLRKHLKAIIIIFASSIAVTIYVNSDMTILGLICDDYSVGLYSRSVRIYTIIKQMVASMIIVALPRLSADLINKNGEGFRFEVSKILKNILMIILPVGIGLSCTSKYIMMIIAGKQYNDAVMSLSILGISSIFAVLSSFTTYCFLLPLKLEKIQMKITAIAAVFNIVANFAVLPILKQNGAAITTLISELFVFSAGTIYILCKTKYKETFKLNSNEVIALIVGSSEIVFVTCLINMTNNSDIVKFIATVVISAICYSITLIVSKYESMCKIIVSLKKEFCKRRHMFKNIM